MTIAKNRQILSAGPLYRFVGFGLNRDHRYLRKLATGLHVAHHLAGFSGALLQRIGFRDALCTAKAKGASLKFSGRPTPKLAVCSAADGFHDGLLGSADPSEGDGGGILLDDDVEMHFSAIDPLFDEILSERSHLRVEALSPLDLRSDKIRLLVFRNPAKVRRFLGLFPSFIDGDTVAHFGILAASLRLGYVSKLPNRLGYAITIFDRYFAGHSGLESNSMYTRAQALSDGALVDVSAAAREAGFTVPVALTRGAWNEAVALTKAAKRAGNDERGRLHDVVSMLRFAIKMKRPATPHGRGCAMLYQLLVVRDRVTPTRTTLSAVSGPGDDMEPVITIMLPGED